MKPDPMPCCSCCRKVSADVMVVLISTTALPARLAALITADSSVSVLLIGASGATSALPVEVTLISRGATTMVATDPASAPTTALMATMPRMPWRRRGFGTGCTGDGDTGAGSVGGGRY